MAHSVAASRIVSRSKGFSVLELAVVLAVSLTLAAVAVPAATNMISLFKLRNSVAEYAGILQQTRIRSVQDSKYYSAYFNTSTKSVQAFIGIKGSTVDPSDPLVAWTPEVQPQVKSNAPNPTGLKAAFLPAGTSITPVDASVSSSPVTFGPMGLPCVVSSGVCATPGQATAYWVFFQDTATQQWEAVTVTPAGYIQKWTYSGTTWSSL